MRRIRIVKCTVERTVEGNRLHVEGIDIMALTEEEYEVLKEVLTAEGYRDLPIS